MLVSHHIVLIENKYINVFKKTKWEKCQANDRFHITAHVYGYVELWHIIREVTTTIILYSVDDICVRKKLVPAIRTIDYDVDSLFLY